MEWHLEYKSKVLTGTANTTTRQSLPCYTQQHK